MRHKLSEVRAKTALAQMKAQVYGQIVLCQMSNYNNILLKKSNWLVNWHYPYINAIIIAIAEAPIVPISSPMKKTP